MTKGKVKMKKYVCQVCGYVYEGNEPPEFCPQCKAPKSKFAEQGAAENGATAGKLAIAKRAKELGYDAIHDTVHEMCKDEARHGRAFEGLLKRYF